MLYQILVHTPIWVWGLLALLIALGVSRLRTRQIPVRRLIVLPLVIAGLSLFGTFSVFHGTLLTAVLWGGATLLSGAWFASADIAPGTRYDAGTGLFTIPGSWAPLVTMMVIFTLRYSMAVAMAIHPQWTHDPVIAATAASLYGALSGMFLGRLGRMLRVLRQEAPQPAPQTASQWG